ncbi:leucine rich repeat containing 51 [Entelurus aequoreus]|uniref:leucine rich repeat containing 51 n=1 Tax=Entelurus aequoreus TaxID=161455 RepID=UPI002B1E8250|nr:leucine rich repeat containing 51 [Entelurus aequoreus]
MKRCGAPVDLSFKAISNFAGRSLNLRLNYFSLFSHSEFSLFDSVSVLCELPELRVLYLHGNRIFTLSGVDKLGVLPHLHTITLHGNIIESRKAYRTHVILALPGLKTMDFSAVTPQERTLAHLWQHSTTNTLH